MPGGSHRCRCRAPWRVESAAYRSDRRDAAGRTVGFWAPQLGSGLLEALAASPYATNTVMVFSADSGVACGSHGLIGKQNCYDHSLRVPLIIAGPGIPADQRTQALCYLFDVLPTMGRWCGVAAPEDSEGMDLAATLTDPSKAARRRLVFAYKSVQRALRDERWKLIHYPQVNKVQLFDLQADPYETNDLASKPECSARVAELTAALKQELQSSGDTGELKVDHPKPAEWSPPAVTKTHKPNDPTPAKP